MEATSATELLTPLKASLREDCTEEKLHEVHEQPRLKRRSQLTAMVASAWSNVQENSTEVCSLRLCLDWSVG